jgi:hypothetical protein
MRKFVRQPKEIPMRDLFFNQAIRVLEAADVRLDANETAFLERELTQLRTRVFEVQYPDLLARRFVPLATDIASSAERYAYKVWDKTGKAKVIANDIDDAPRIDVSATEVTGRVYPVGASYGWGLNEIREAVRTGTPLNQQRAVAARNAIELGVDQMLAEGYTTQPGETNLITKGLVNNAAVEGAAFANVTSLTNWTMATDPDDILAELYGMIAGIVTDSKQVFRPNTVLMGTNRYNIIAQKKVGVDNDTTILRSFLANNPYIQSVDQWYRLDGAGENSTGRIIVYQRDPMVLEGVVPQEFEQLPPQARNFEFVVNCHARCGGVKIYQPSAVKYGDFPG